MNISKEHIEQFLGKKVRIITKVTHYNFTYVGFIDSFGDDYINFIDKYSKKFLISISTIHFIEEVSE
jgi:hypothetical protein